MAQMSDVTPRILEKLVRCARMIAAGTPSKASLAAAEALRALSRAGSKRTIANARKRAMLRRMGGWT